MEGDLEFALEAQAPRLLEARDVHEQVLLRQDEILLKEAEAGEVARRIRQEAGVGIEPRERHRLPPEQTHGWHGARCGRAAQLDVLEVPGQRVEQAHGARGLRQEQAQSAKVEAVVGDSLVQPEPEPQGVRHARPALEARRDQGQGCDVDVVAGAEAATRPLHRDGLHLRPGGNDPDVLVGSGLRGESDDRSARKRAQQLRPEQPYEGVDDLREIVLEPLPDPGGEEGEPFKETLHVRVGPGPDQSVRDSARVGAGVLAAHVPQERQLFLVEPGEHPSILPGVRRRSPDDRCARGAC